MLAAVGVINMELVLNDEVEGASVMTAPAAIGVVDVLMGTRYAPFMLEVDT
jgi:hypothetical protein